MENKKVLKGGGFILKESKASDTFIPEEFNEEQIMISDMCNDFLDKEVLSSLDRIDNMEQGLMKSLLSKSGELGLLGISIPEEYGGFGQSFVTSMLASDILGGGYSYAVAYSAHTGIGTLPILYYGTEEQKQKYLPKLASGEFAGAYCLTEPNAGSDANSGKSKAVLSIVEKNFPGVSFNPEEKKMGIKGSSTVQIFFNDCEVPVENLLGKRGEGFRIAVNILHIGRIKLGANVLGAGRKAIIYSVNYANERKQFGSFISNFGAIKLKLSEQSIKQFVAEAAVYRTSKYVDDAIKMNMANGMNKIQAYIEALGEYSMEAAILKVFGSETLDYITDEAVQIFGGMGFSAEMPVDRAYRDSRINRIFEGTNEINRLVACDMFLKQAKKADSEIFTLAKDIYEKLDSLKNNITSDTDFSVKKHFHISNLKKACILMLGKSYEAVGKKYSTEQEIMMNISDMLIQLYVAESVVLRVEKLENIKTPQEYIVYKDICDVFVYEASSKIYKSAIDALCSFASGDEFVKIQNGIRTLTSIEPVNIKEARRRIADKLIEDNTYKF